VLHFAREMRVHIVECDLADVVDDALSLAGGAIVEKLIKVSTKGSESLMVWADPLLLGQALLNLILNAVQASEKGGMVVVEFTGDANEGKQFRLAVEDCGPGISPEIMDKIFDPFFTTKDEGTGLGLAIVHRVVEAHEGVISASNRDGGGARFEIRI
jgi:two-component system sensor histidine kinase HydH